MPAPELTALLSAAPADGEEVMDAAALSVADKEMADEISLTMEEAVATGFSVLHFSFIVAELVVSRTTGNRALPRPFNSAGADVWIVAESESVVLQTACHDPIFAFVAATHFPESGTEPTKLEQP